MDSPGSKKKEEEDNRFLVNIENNINMFEGDYGVFGKRFGSAEFDGYKMFCMCYGSSFMFEVCVAGSTICGFYGV